MGVVYTPGQVPYGQIYALCDPRTNEVRYIGQTTTSLERRLSGHLKEPKKATHKSCWIASLAPFIPAISHLSWASSKADLDQQEIRKIAELKLLGARLVNASPGGHNGPASAETRQRMSAVRRGKSLSGEGREKVAAAKRGVKRSPDTVAKMAAAATGRVHSEESRAKMSSSRAGIPKSPEWQASQTGRKRSPETIAKMKEAQALRRAREKTWE